MNVGFGRITAGQLIQRCQSLCIQFSRYLLREYTIENIQYYSRITQMLIIKCFYSTIHVNQGKTMLQK